MLGLRPADTSVKLYQEYLSFSFKLFAFFLNLQEKSAAHRGLWEVFDFLTGSRGGVPGVHDTVSPVVE